jgi:hypothetical protein
VRDRHHLLSTDSTSRRVARIIHPCLLRVVQLFVEMKIFRNIAESLRSHSPSGRRKAKEPQGSGATEVPGTQHKAQPPSQSPPESSKSRPPGASLPSTSPEPKVAQNVNSISSNENVVVDTSKYSNVPNLRQLSVKEKNDKQAKNDMPGTSGSNKIHDEAVSPVLCDDGKALEDTDLWLKARNDLKADVREKFDKHFKNQDLFSIDQVSECIRGVKADCEKGSWGYVIKDGKKIVYRDIFDKVITWAVAFKDVGAAVAAFDPTQHAQLAWGAVGVIVTVGDFLPSVARYLI